MEQKKLFKRLFAYILLASLAPALMALDKLSNAQVEIESNADFSFAGGQKSMALIFRPLKEHLQSIDALRTAEAVGVVHIGRITLKEPSSALNAMRNIAVQISKALDVDMALVTDSKTSSQLAPHELMLLYHPNLVITLVLTYSFEEQQYDLIGTYAISKSDPPS